MVGVFDPILRVRARGERRGAARVGRCVSGGFFDVSVRRTDDGTAGHLTCAKGTLGVWGRAGGTLGVVFGAIARIMSCPDIDVGIRVGRAGFRGAQSNPQ